MVAFNTVKVGDVLYDPSPPDRLTRKRSYWLVRVLEVHGGHAVCSWNGNSPDTYYPYSFKRLRRSPPKE